MWQTTIEANCCPMYNLSNEQTQLHETADGTIAHIQI